MPCRHCLFALFTFAEDVFVPLGRRNNCLKTFHLDQTVTPMVTSVLSGLQEHDLPDDSRCRLNDTIQKKMKMTM